MLQAHSRQHDTPPFADVRIVWKRCSRRRWPKTSRLAFTPEQRRKVRCVLLYFWAGQGWRRLPTGTVRVTAGSCHWSRPGWAYTCDQDPESPLGITAVHFDMLDPQGSILPPDNLALPNEVLDITNPELARSITDHIANIALDLRASVAVSPTALRAAEVMFKGLLWQLCAGQLDTTPATTTNTLQWTAVTKYLQEHLYDLPSLTEIANEWGLSRSHFSREFKKHVGLTPMTYIINARTASAKELLRDSTLQIGQVAEYVGYRDVFAFSRQFRKVTGVTPSDYREASQGQG